MLKRYDRVIFFASGCFVVRCQGTSGRCPRSTELRFGKVRMESPGRADSEIGAPVQIGIELRFGALVAKYPDEFRRALF